LAALPVVQPTAVEALTCPLDTSTSINIIRERLRSRPHWLLLIYSFQFRSAARAAPAPCTPTSTTPTSVTHSPTTLWFSY